MLPLNETMHPDDHMLTANLESYFKTARSAIDCIIASLKSAEREASSIRSVLDFGSGYGRVYRALSAMFPHAQLTACDLMEPAARFCAETFGGDWVRSDEDLSTIELPRQYDLIWLGSVFTHLPAYRWVRLLDFLHEACTPGGLVVFTCHGDRAINHIESVLLKRNPYAIDAFRFEAMKYSLPKIGFDFIPNKPAAIKHQHDRGISVSHGEYGFSFSTEGWVRRLIQEMPEWKMVRYAAPGWAGNHDAVTIMRI